MIERVGRLNFQDNEALPIEQLGPSQKFLKWVTKILESVDLDEIRNKITWSSTRRENGGDAYNSNLGDVEDMDVSYDCELNLSINLVTTSFEKVASHAKWK